MWISVVCKNKNVNIKVWSIFKFKLIFEQVKNLFQDNINFKTIFILSFESVKQTNLSISLCRRFLLKKNLKAKLSE